jgi:hypothetical protein
MSARERILIGAAAGVVLLFVLAFVLVPRMGGSGRMTSPARAGSLAAMRADAEARIRQSTRLRDMAADLSVKLPTVAPDSQVEQIVQGVEGVIQKSGIELTAFTPRASGGRDGRQRRAGNLVQFDLRFAAQHAALFGFFRELDAAGLPWIVESVDVRMRQNEPQKVDVVLAMAFMLLEPMPAEPEVKQ